MPDRTPSKMVPSIAGKSRELNWVEVLEFCLIQAGFEAYGLTLNPKIPESPIPCPTPQTLNPELLSLNPKPYSVLVDYIRRLSGPRIHPSREVLYNMLLIVNPAKSSRQIIGRGLQHRCRSSTTYFRGCKQNP